MANFKNTANKSEKPQINRADLDKNKNLQFMEMAEKQSEESHCIRAERRVGVIAVLNDEIIAGAANGTVGKIPSCADLGYCIREKLGIAHGERLEITYCVCAEQRLVCMAAKNGIKLNGSTVYVTHMPCAICIRLLIESGISRVYYRHEFPSPFTLEICEMAGFDLIKI